jgi:hypothetical protein
MHGDWWHKLGHAARVDWIYISTKPRQPVNVAGRERPLDGTRIKSRRRYWIRKKHCVGDSEQSLSSKMHSAMAAWEKARKAAAGPAIVVCATCSCNNDDRSNVNVTNMRLANYYKRYNTDKAG